jgi:DcmR-like sensory protein
VLHKLDASLHVESHVASGHLDVRPSSEVYLRGGRFSMTDMVAFYEQYLTVATADGGTARVAGEGAWAVEGYPGVEHLIDYEIELNRMVRRHRQMILCLYDLEALGGALVVDLLRTHPKIVLAGMPIENPNYLTPEEFSTARGSNARPELD